MRSDQTGVEPPLAWFPQAGFGVFIHWGIFSVPAWAPLPPAGQTVLDILRDDPRHFGARIPYTEWYQNAMAIEGSPTQVHHRQTYGDAPYENFRSEFEDGLDGWDPDEWAELFAASGAGYVVLVTKHHDGYCLWPTEVEHPNRKGWHSRRDLVGELAVAVRARGLRFGVYYSTGFDWSVHHEPVRELFDSAGCVPRSPDYLRYMTEQLDELVDRYRPSVVWADLGVPRGFDLAGFKDRLRSTVPEALVNDRWDRPLPGSWRPGARKVLNAAFRAAGPKALPSPFFPGRHRLADFRTPEYSWPQKYVDYLWETTRGMGVGFAHNRDESESMKLDGEQLVTMVREIRELGGNLLLNVGPLADGTISETDAARLRHLGSALGPNPTIGRRPT